MVNMNKKIAILATALTLIVMSAAGFVDSVIDDRAGPAALFALIALGIAVMAKGATAESGIALRRDLDSWLERVSPVTGETVAEMNDRAVSRLRAGFTAEPPAEG